MMQIIKKIKAKVMNTLEKNGTTTTTPVKPKTASSNAATKKNADIIVTKFKCMYFNLIIILF